MKSNYKNNKDIILELRRLKLKRDISIEELKLIKEDFKHDLSLGNWVKTIIVTFGKLGTRKLIKKIMT